MKKRILAGCCFILAATFLTLLCMKRWNAWFGNPTEPPYTPLASPGRVQLTLGTDGACSRMVSWQCGDTLAASELTIAQQGFSDTLNMAATGRLFHTTGGTTVIYHVTLNQLNAGIYHYRVSTAGLSSPWFEFQVSHPDSVSFVYLGDIQDTINGVTRNFVHRIADLHPQARFWVLGGDVIERPHDQYWNEYFRSVDSIASSIPFVAVPGNHEYVKGVTRRLEERFIYTFPYLAENRYRGHAVSAMTYGDLAIITLDSNRDFWTLPSQRRWLKHTLETYRDIRWKVVVLHHPIYSIKGKMNNLMVRMAFNGLLKKHGVDLVLQGHEHGYARMTSKTRKGAATPPVYLVSQASPKDYRLHFNKRYDRFGTGQRFYSVVSVSGDSLFIQSYTETNELYDRLCLVKNETGKQVIDFSGNLPEQLRFNSQRRHMSEEKRREYERDMNEWLNRNH